MAILGLVGCGLVDSFARAVEQVARVIETRQPRPEIQARYEEYYQLYRAAYFALLPVFDQAAWVGE